MTQKEEITEMLKDGASYDRVEQTTGAERAYIRQVASSLRKRDEENKVSDKEDKPKITSKKEDTKKSEVDDSLEFETKVEKKKEWDGDKTGLQHHKDWVAEKKYECECGCTLNRKGDFCPHCGVGLDWGGIDG